MLVIPWPVIQEIDCAMKKNNSRLSADARHANNFIFDCLKKQHPRFFGQSFVDFKDNFKNTVSIDDCILQYCLQLRASRNNVVSTSQYFLQYLTNEKIYSSHNE